MEIHHVPRTNITDMLKLERLTTICAPMVRYSKLPFRLLVRKYNCDVAFTPMIIADSFVKSLKARDNEFSTCKEDRPLIVQFAANNPKDFADAAEIVAPFADGVDLNCGCPQRWAAQEGYGACLIHKPELLASIVSETKNRIPDPDFSISVKIRIHKDIRKTVELCRCVEKTGVSWIAVHGRTKDQRAQSADMEAVRLIKESVSVPVIANGDICSLDDAAQVQRSTGVHGVMTARGILANPAMFAGYEKTPQQCVQDWVDISLATGTSFSIFHHHLAYMLEEVVTKTEKRLFNCLGGTCSVLNFLSENYGIHSYQKQSDRLYKAQQINSSLTRINFLAISHGSDLEDAITS